MDQDLQQFLEGFDSVWTLELLLALRARGERSWQAASLIEELRSSESIVQHALTRLRAAGLVVEAADGGYRYQPVTPQIAGLVERLVDEYRSRPGVIRRAIVSPQNTKLRSFSDAFMFRKPNK